MARIPPTVGEVLKGVAPLADDAATVALRNFGGNTAGRGNAATSRTKRLKKRNDDLPPNPRDQYPPGSLLNPDFSDVNSSRGEITLDLRDPKAIEQLTGKKSVIQPAAEAVPEASGPAMTARPATAEAASPAAVEALLAEPSDGFSKFITAADGISNTLNTAVFVPDVLGMAGTGLGFLGAKKVESALHKPKNFMNQSFGDLGKKFGISAPKFMKDAPAGTSIFNGTMLAGPAIGALTGARRIMKNVGLLKEINEDVTGKKNQESIPLSLLGADAPEAVKTESIELKKDLLETGVNAASLVFGAHSWLKKGVVPMLSFFLPMFVPMGLNIFFGESGGGKAYKDLKKVAKSGQHMPADLYAKVVGSADKQLRSRGGTEGAFAQAVATRLEADQVQPVELIKMINNGQLKQQYIDAVIAEHEAAKAQSHTTPEAPKETDFSFKKMVTHGPEVNRPNLGKYTSKESQTNQETLGAAAHVR